MQLKTVSYSQRTPFLLAISLIDLKFLFLPVGRIAIKLNIPYVNNIVETCTDRQCESG